MNKASYQTELDNYFKTANNSDVPERVIYKGSLSKARNKLKYEAFIEMNDHMNTHYAAHFQTKKWNGFNLIAFDGSTARVPDEPEIAEHFGAWNTVKGKNPCPLSRVSQMFDVLNHITLDAIISPKSEGERELAAIHLLKIMADDLVLLDRGYAAFWLFKLIISLLANFCARMSCTKWKVIRQFYESGLPEAVVKLNPPPSSIQKCKEMGLDTKPIKLRLIRVELESGETEILATTLKNMNEYPIDLFAELYHCRWPIEEDYKTMKCRIEMESFSGKSVLSVYQDFHAKVFSKNMTSIIINSVHEEVHKRAERCKFERKVNFTQALSKIKHTIILLLTRTYEELQTLVDKIRDIFIKTTESIRPNRKYERIHRVKQKRYHNAYKPIS